MAFDDSIRLELVKGTLSAGLILLGLALGWLVGQRFVVHWAIRQKRRELELAAASQFYHLYGEFYAVWKVWNYFTGDQWRRYDVGPVPDTTRWDLLTRAASAEAGVESILVKLASERRLTDDDIAALGSFRQAYQTLREAVRDGVHIDWPSQDCPEYVAFKHLACRVASMLSASEQWRPPSGPQAAQALRGITSNVWETSWISTGLADGAC